MSESKKNILYLAHWYPNKEQINRGIFIKKHAACIHDVANIVVIDFSILNSTKLYSSKIFRNKDENGVDTIHIHVRSVFHKFCYYWIFFQNRLLKKALRQMGVEVNDFDVIHTNVLFPSGIVGWNIAKKNKTPLVHTEHWSYVNTFLKKDVHRFKGRKVFDYAKKIVVVSDLLKRNVIEFCAADKVEIIPNLIDSSFHFEPKKHEKIIQFLAVANWRLPKNPFLFLDALKELMDDGTLVDCKVVLVGEGPQLNEIKKKDYPMNIDFVGAIENKELTNYYRDADFFLHASNFETFSIVSIESLMSGTPVIGSKVGVLTEVINPSNGVLCDNTISSWKEGIKKATSSEYDYRAISESVNNAYSKERISNSFREVYDSIN